MKKGMFVVLLSVMLFQVPVYATEGTAGDYMIDIGAKLGRGLVNAVSSPAEIPCTMKQDMKDSPWGGFFTGFGKGTGLMLRRLLVGVTEVGTFMIPMPPDLAPVCSSPEPAIASA